MGRIAGMVLASLTLYAGAVRGQVLGGPEEARALVQKGMAEDDGPAATAALDEAIAISRGWVAREPMNPDAHALLAVALGARLEHHGLRTKVRMAGEVRSEAEAALALDPDHPEAHHVLGRLHAAAMRLNPLARTLARAVLGATALEGASWDSAEVHFQAALGVEPWNPRHAMELGALYLDTGRRGEARTVLMVALQGSAAGVGGEAALVRARDLLARAAGAEG